MMMMMMRRRRMGGALMMIEDTRWTLQRRRLLLWVGAGSYLDGAGCYFGALAVSIPRLQVYAWQIRAYVN